MHRDAIHTEDVAPRNRIRGKDVAIKKNVRVQWREQEGLFELARIPNIRKPQKSDLAENSRSEKDFVLRVRVLSAASDQGSTIVQGGSHWKKDGER